jgi:hypothetical protein
MAQEQIDTGRGQTAGGGTFDGFWLEQASTQTTRKVSGTNGGDENRASKAIQGLPKDGLRAISELKQ